MMIESAFWGLIEVATLIIGTKDRFCLPSQQSNDRSLHGIFATLVCIRLIRIDNGQVYV